MMLWDVGTYDRVLTIRATGSAFRQAAFSPEGSVLGAIAGVPPKSTLHLWRAPSMAEIASAEAQRARGAGTGAVGPVPAK